MAKVDKEEVEFNKIYIREAFLPNKKNIRVLDAFSGNGVIWASIRARNPNIEFEIDRVDKVEGLKGDYNIMNNMEFMKNNDVRKYDAIDLDSNTHPFKQMQHLIKCKYRGAVYCTLKESKTNKFPKKMLLDMGYASRMVDKAPKLFQLNSFNKFCLYLSRNGVDDIYYIDSGKFKIFTFVI